MTDRLKKEDFVRLLAARMKTDEATATAWVDGIDAADCTPFPHNASFWHWFLDYYQTENPAYVPTLLQMMQTIAEHPELPDLVEQELLSAPYPALRTGVLTPYSERLRTTYAGLVEALRISKIK